MASGSLPTGDWLELIDTSMLPVLRQSTTMQVSSYDRTGGNDDGFSGVYSYLREEADGGFVLFDAEGPGCVYRIWSANPGQRRIEFYFDGERKPRLVFDSWEDMFLDKVEPFVPPFSDHVIGGYISYVPLPYEKSLKIVARDRINFLQISYQQFPEDREVQSFSPELSAETREKMARVKAVWEKPGVHPWPRRDAQSESMTLNLPADTSAGVRLSGDGMVTALKLRLDALPTPALRELVLRINVDGGAAEVEAPWGDFFLQPFPEENVQSMLCGRMPEDPLTFYSYWPMPYQESLYLEFVNGGGTALACAIEIETAPLDRPFEELGYFHAKWQRQNPTEEGRLFPILDIKGRGHWVGFSAAMQGYGPGHGYLEGDEMMWWDGRDNTSYNGTGSEDYYNGGWYFGYTDSFPYFGCGYLREAEGRCHAFRLHVSDLVPFQDYARIGIEHGHANEYTADYAGTTFFYAAADAELVRPAMPEVQARLWTPVSLPEYLEAEALVENVQAESSWQASGGAAVAVPAEGLVLRLDLPIEDIYTPYLRFLGEAAASEVIVSVNESMSFRMRVESSDNGAFVLAGEPARLVAGSQLVEVFAPGGALLDAIRFAPSLKTPDVVEAEHLTVAAIGGARVERADVFPTGMSGHSGVAIQHHRENDGAEFTWEVAEAGSYRIAPRLYHDPARMPVRLTLDGEPLGLAIVCSTAGQLGWPDHSESRLTPRIEAGAHKLGLLCAQTPVEGTGPTTFIDYFEIRPKGLYEGEGLKVLEASGAPADEQGLGGYSNDAQLWFRPTAPDAVLKLAVDVTEAGTYTVCARFAMAPDYGRYHLLVNDKQIGEVFDGYASSLRRSEEICFGTAEFKAGANEITFRGAGKNADSSSYMLGLDLLLVK
jgi:hypothetical protein